MELRKKWILRLDGEDTPATTVREGNGQLWVETSSGERVEDAQVLDGGRTVSVRVGGRMYLVDITPRGVKPVRALVNGKGGPLEILDELAAAAAEAGGGAGGVGDVVAQMPGLVVDVKCEVGQAVTRGQALVVLEAMKMQNELAAPGDGVVEEVLVSPGQGVEGGAVLVRLAPPATGDEG